MTSSRSISDAVNSRSRACSLSRDGLMDAGLGVVDIAIILSPICLPLPSFYSAPWWVIASRVGDGRFFARALKPIGWRRRFGRCTLCGRIVCTAHDEFP